MIRVSNLLQAAEHFRKGSGHVCAVVRCEEKPSDTDAADAVVRRVLML